MLVKPGRLGNAAGITQMMQSFDVILSPILAVPLHLAFGLGGVFVVDFVTVGVSIIALLLSVVPQPVRKLEDTGGSIWSEFRFGLRYVAARRPFQYLLFLVTALMFMMPGIGYALATPLALSFSNETGAVWPRCRWRSVRSGVLKIPFLIKSRFRDHAVGIGLIHLFPKVGGRTLSGSRQA